MSEWTTPNSDAIDIKKDEPDSSGAYPEYIGKYEDSVSFPSSFDATKLSYIYKFVDLEGNLFSIFGFTTLNRFMEATPKGSLVKIQYAGMGKNKKGQDLHKCKVQYKQAEDVTSETLNRKSEDDLPF